MNEDLQEAQKMCDHCRKGLAYWTKRQSQLAEPDKPELRHGDVWDDEVLGPIIILGNLPDTVHVDPGDHLQADKHRVFSNSAESPSTSARRFCFNIFDDLKALSEPLDKFEINLHRTVRVCMWENTEENKRYLHIEQDDDMITIPRDIIPELILKLRRMVTAEKDQHDTDD